MARWQRERRQQAVVVIVFSTALLFVLGLAAWAATNRYYADNLQPAAIYDGRVIPMREYQRELRFQLVNFYVSFGVPREFENDPQIQRDKAAYEAVAIDRLIEYAALENAAREEGVAFSRAAIEERYARDLGQVKTRHVLVSPDQANTDTAAADVAALEEAQRVAAMLRFDPNDQDLWNSVALEHSDDPGSKDSGGELGFAAKGQFVKEFEDAVADLDVGELSEPVKSSFGYHVIQLRERRPPQESDLVQRLLATGFSLAEVQAHVRYDMLREEFVRRAQEVAVQSSAEQIRLAQIVISIPQGDPQAFAEGLRKLSEATSELEKGTDFGEVAKSVSEDAESAESGGDIGWFARGMFDELRVEEELFKLAPGARSQQFSTEQRTTIYKVLEKEADRALTDEQKATIKEKAYDYWLEREKREHGATTLITAFQF